MKQNLHFTAFSVLLGATSLAAFFSNTSKAAVTPSALSSVTSIQRGALDSATQSKLIADYGKLPLSFEANQGQTDSRVKFLSRGAGYRLFLTPGEAVLALSKPLDTPPTLDERKALSAARNNAIVRMKLIGANPQPQIVGMDHIPGTSNYFIGNDPKQWRTDVPHYAQVKYQQVYPGIDLVYHGNQRQLEYDFIISPGANPQAINFAFGGPDRIGIDDRGELVLHTKAGEIKQHKPIIYQEIDGERRLIDGHYVLKSKGEIGFQMARYDRAKPLVIDPVLIYSTFLGGSSPDYADFGVGRTGGIAVDASGNAYVTGATSSTDFPTTAGAFQTSGGGAADAFVTKLNNTGTALIYSTYLGGGSLDGGFAIAIDSSNNAYVTGGTSSSDFPTTAGAFDTTCGGCSTGHDAFVTKLNAAGNALLYSTYLGGDADEDVGIGIALDSARNVYVTGATVSSDFPVTAGAFQTTYHGGSDAFVTKLNATGTALVYSTFLGGTGSIGLNRTMREQGNAIAVDSARNAYITGRSNSHDFPLKNPLESTPDFGFVTKLNATGTALVYSTYLGDGAGDFGTADIPLGIAVDSSGNAYVTGFFFCTANSCATVFKLNNTGSAFLYATYLGAPSSGFNVASKIALDSANNAYVVGHTPDSAFPTTAGAPDTTFNGGSHDAIMFKLDSAGTLVFSTFLGGGGQDLGIGIAVDAAGNAYVTGFTQSSNFPTTAGAFDSSCDTDGTCNGGGDAYITKIGTSVPRCFGRVPTIVGTAASETINGTAGNDVIVGLGGDDTINGNGGNDRICGGAGNDALNGGGGTDSCDGGPGTDTATACETVTHVP